MLRIFFNYGCTNIEKTEAFLQENGLKEILDVDEYFDVTYGDDWITTDFAKRVIKGVDRTEVVSTSTLKSPVLGIMPPQWLSGGTKGLLLLAYDKRKDVILRSSVFGDNCAPYLLELAAEKDITLIGRHLIDFGKFTDDICILNVPKVCHGYSEYIATCREVIR